MSTETDISKELHKELKEVKREWKNLKSFKNQNHLLFTAIVVALVAILAVNTIFILQNVNQNGDAPAVTVVPSGTRVVTSNQVAHNPATTAQVRAVTENNTKDYAFTIDPSETMLLMHLKVTNESPTVQHFFPSIQLYVRSDEGDYAALHASLYAKSPIPATDLKPGESVEGDVSFNVPKRVARPLLYIDTGWSNYGPLVIDVLH